MLIIESPLLLRQQARLFRQQDMSIALVPTAGNLHQGHIKLVEVAHTKADVVIVSIFNPMPLCHPYDPQADYEKLSQAGTGLVFAPQLKAFYPNGMAQHTAVNVPLPPAITQDTSRRGHFRAIATLWCKLFSLVLPDSACFGEKDYLELHIIRQLTADMGFDTDIISVPAVRDETGLALSAGNRHLTEQQRAIAPGLYQVMQQLAASLAAGEYRHHKPGHTAVTQLETLGFHNITLHICDADNLAPLSETSHKAVILLTAWLGETRLTDSLVQPLPVTIPAGALSD